MKTQSSPKGSTRIHRPQKYFSAFYRNTCVHAYLEKSFDEDTERSKRQHMDTQATEVLLRIRLGHHACGFCQQ